MDPVGKLVYHQVAQVTEDRRQKQGVGPGQQQQDQRRQKVLPGVKGPEHVAVPALVFRVKEIYQVV
jgi:hypothetical protein